MTNRVSEICTKAVERATPHYSMSIAEAMDEEALSGRRFSLAALCARQFYGYAVRKRLERVIAGDNRPLTTYELANRVYDKYVKS